MNLNDYIKKCKKIIELPYNKFNLDNYASILVKEYLNYDITFDKVKEDGPIKLMSGQHRNAIILNTKCTTSDKRKVYLVGKGVLFDSGGYDLKDDMKDMNTDMAGMAIAMAVASYINNPNVIAYCPVATNFIHNNGIIPCDQIKIGDKTVEVLNTDAEGRLILAEALSHLKPTKNDIIITIATLTGACAYAIGDKATAVLSPSDILAELYYKASLKTKELAWRLPLWEYLDKKLKKKVVPNILKDKCGTINAALFLKQFVKYPNNWIHLDIAYSSYDEDKRKATGEPIKTLVEFIKKLGV